MQHCKSTVLQYKIKINLKKIFHYSTFSDENNVFIVWLFHFCLHNKEQTHFNDELLSVSDYTYLINVLKLQERIKQNIYLHI